MALLLLPDRGWHAQIIITDDMRVRQIIMNGLTNAAKYSNPPLNGAIRVVASIEHQFDDVDQVPAGLRGSFRRGNRGKLSGAPRATTTAVAAYSGTVPDAESPRQSWLCIDVLDCGPGLQGVSEKVIFTDFACPVMMSPVPNNNHVGSSGVGLPICARYGWQCVLRRIFTLKVSVFVLVSPLMCVIAYSLGCVCVCFVLARVRQIPCRAVQARCASRWRATRRRPDGWHARRSLCAAHSVEGAAGIAGRVRHDAARHCDAAVIRSKYAAFGPEPIQLRPDLRDSRSTACAGGR